jgi:hypothetical protein
MIALRLIFACSGFLTGPLRDWPNGLMPKAYAFFLQSTNLFGSWQRVTIRGAFGLSALDFGPHRTNFPLFHPPRRLNDAWPTGIGAVFRLEVILLPLTVAVRPVELSRCRPFLSGVTENVSDRFVHFFFHFATGLDLERQAEKAGGHLRS